MSSRLPILIFASILLLVVSNATCVCGNDDLTEIAGIIPTDANALTIVDHVALAESQWAKSNGIEASELIGAPADASQVVIASNLDFQHLRPQSQITFMKIDGQIAGDALLREKQYVDEIGDTKLFWTGNRTSVSMINDGCLAIMQGRNRQQVGNWIRNSLSRPDDNRASVFLKYALNQANQDNSLAVVAFDFQDSFSPTFVRDALVGQSNVEPSNRAEIVQLGAGLEGAVITINAETELLARVQFRFVQDAAILKDEGLDLLNSALGNMGAQIREMQDWQLDVDDNVVTIHGPLTRKGFEDILSLAIYDSQTPAILRHAATLVDGSLHSGSVANSSESEGAAPSESPSSSTTSNRRSAPEASVNEAEKANVKKEATKDYMEHVQNLLNSLHRKTDATFAQSRFWLDRYAFKIQYLNRENVDEELLAFADQATKKLRKMAEEIENALLESAEEYESGWIGTPTWRTVNYGGMRIRRRAYFYGGNSFGNDRPAVDRLQAKDELNDAGVKVKAAGIEIVRDYNAVGRDLAKKYDFDFERWTPGGIR